VRTNFVIVSTPFLAYSAHLVERHEPVCIQALSPKLAVRGFNEGIVGRFAWPAEVKNDAALVGPQIQILRDELRSLINADALGIAELFADAVEHLDNTCSPPIEPRFDGRRELGESINDCQHANLRGIEQLVMNKIPLQRLQANACRARHGPHFISC
jgi:hypothetical protein